VRSAARRLRGRAAPQDEQRSFREMIDARPRRFARDRLLGRSRSTVARGVPVRSDEAWTPIPEVPDSVGGTRSPACSLALRRSARTAIPADAATFRAGGSLRCLQAGVVGSRIATFGAGRRLRRRFRQAGHMSRSFPRSTVSPSGAKRWRKVNAMGSGHEPVDDRAGRARPPRWGVCLQRSTTGTRSAALQPRRTPGDVSGTPRGRSCT
jgi:hypothetical protein